MSLVSIKPLRPDRSTGPKWTNLVPKRKNTPGTKSGGGAKKYKHSAETDKIRAENDKIEVPKKKG
ncbi:Uncharacterized protein APZ42_013117 [Daphnia magna]|uniref:Uncharacterized protein n=1 Tax=Daphnia magna TaxID=35525 RepID=A0A162R5G2_9CRUS|nr:Uncharacterized protein APZ42_013117 [Daphnia magna]